MNKALELLKTELEEVETDISQLAHERQEVEDNCAKALKENRLNSLAQQEMAAHLREAIVKSEAVP